MQKLEYEEALARVPVPNQGSHGNLPGGCVHSDEILGRCEHGFPEGRGCEECEYWERVDYEYDRYMDR
jgi:hypothetical protein